MIPIKSKFLYKYNGMTIWPFLLIRHENDLQDDVFMNHELIHAAQQKELLLIVFYLWYGIDYSYQLMKYRNHFKAYRNIIFEREAYAMEGDLKYLKRRKFFSFLNYYFN